MISIRLLRSAALVGGYRLAVGKARDALHPVGGRPAASSSSRSRLRPLGRQVPDRIVDQCHRIAAQMAVHRDLVVGQGQHFGQKIGQRQQ